MELTNISVIKELFDRHGFSFSKTLGQNFLINPAVCPKIAELGGADENIGAIEIGTGVGVLTKELALRCKKVVAVEIDEGLKPILDETLSDFKNIEIVFADILKTDLKKLIAEKFDGMDVIVCANLPYYITSPVIMSLIEQELPIKSITVMVQLEAAQRLCAKPGTRECGAVSAAVSFYSRPEKLFKVSRGSFMPAPNVDSAVIRLNIYDKPPFDVKNKKLFTEIVRHIFSQRRKQIVNPLSVRFKVEKSELAAELSEHGMNPAARPEELSMEDLVSLYHIMEKHID